MFRMHRGRQVKVDTDINLFDLMPLFRMNRGDGGCFIDKACVISRDPDDWDNDDKENVSVYRLQVKGRHRLGIQPYPSTTSRFISSMQKSAARTCISRSRWAPIRC